NNTHNKCHPKISLCSQQFIVAVVNNYTKCKIYIHLNKVCKMNNIIHLVQKPSNRPRKNYNRDTTCHIIRTHISNTNHSNKNLIKREKKLQAQFASMKVNLQIMRHYIKNNSR